MCAPVPTPSALATIPILSLAPHPHPRCELRWGIYSRTQNHKGVGACWDVDREHLDCVPYADEQILKLLLAENFVRWGQEIFLQGTRRVRPTELGLADNMEDLKWLRYVAFLRLLARNHRISGIDIPLRGPSTGRHPRTHTSSIKLYVCRCVR